MSPPRSQTSGQPPVGATAAPAEPAVFKVLPYHVFRVLCALAVLATIVGPVRVSWFLVAVALAAAEWYTRTRRVQWHRDVQELLHRFRLSEAPQPQSTAEPATAVIPFRPLTVQDIFLGAFRVVWNNWPTLVGIPAVILLGTMATTSIVFLVLPVAMIFDSVAGLVALMILYFALTFAVALPGDAMLISTSVFATDKAVRGERVRLGDIFQAARTRMFAVTRLTLVFYGISFAPTIVMMFALFALGLGPGFMALWVACCIGSFVMGILLSLAPIVLVVEKRGVADSLKRAVQLAKPAWARILGIHVLWVAAVVALLMCSWIPVLVLEDLVLLVALPYLVALPFMISYARTVQMLIYTDLRIRQESYERELLADWSKNTQSSR